MMARPLRALLLTTLLLALVILGSSATLRLSANGIGCDPWPSCYGLAETANQAQGSSLAKVLRLTHRTTASAFAILVIAAVAIGWRGWGGPMRLIGLSLIVVTGVLAGVGLYTPSPLPAVTIINVLGGLVLIGLSAALLSRSTALASYRPELPARFMRRAVWTLLALLALQAAVGAMISVRVAGNACAASCPQLTWSPDALALLNPMLSGRWNALSSDLTAGQSLHWLHRILGAALLLTMASIIYVRRVAAGSPWSWLLRVTIATFGLGVASAIWDGQLLVTVTHVLLAGLGAAALGVVGISVARPRSSPT